MAPEEIKQNNYNIKVDIWALGCVFHKLCTLSICFKDYQSIMDGRYGRIDENYYGHFLQSLIDVLLNQDYNKRPKASEIIEFVNSKHIPSEFQRHNINSNNFRSQPIQNFSSNSPHRSNRISRRTHTFQENLNSVSFNGSNRNDFIPYDEENNVHSSISRRNRASFLPPPPIAPPIISSSSNIHQAFIPHSSARNFGFSSSPMHSQSRFGAPTQSHFNVGPSPPSPFNIHGLPPPSPLNIGPTPPPPNYFNTHGGPFHPSSSPVRPSGSPSNSECKIF